MITNRALEAHKLTSRHFRQMFDTDKPTPEVERLTKRWAARAQQGRQWNLQNYRLFLALDRALEQSFRQANQTMIGLIKDLSLAKTEDEAIKTAKRWKMTHLITTTRDEKSGNTAPVEKLSIPALFECTLSIARAYLLQRTSDLTNSRLQSPLIPFEPAFPTMANKARCDVLTSRSEQMAREFGYDQFFRQCIQKTAIYGHQLVFPQEEWFQRKDWTEDGPQPGREGVRLFAPHPSRSYFDIDYPLWTFNLGHGCRYGGYWRVRTWGDVKTERHWWNIDRIKVSTRQLDDEWNVFANTTGQCRIAAPWPFWTNETSQLDRESNINGFLYANHPDASPIWHTEHYEIINPAQDLGSGYPDLEMWVRVVMASDETPLYVGPMNDRAISSFMWEPHDLLQLQISMLLELMGYQDHCTNLLSQGLGAISENMRRLILYNKGLIKKETVDDLRNPNRTAFQFASFLGFDPLESDASGIQIKDIFANIAFEKANVAEHLQMLQQLLQLMERVVGVSAQDVGGYGSHEQKEIELHMIREGTGQRKMLQGFDIDRGLEGIRGVLYAQMMNNSTADAFAYVDKGYSREYLERLGFIIEEVDTDEAGQTRGLLVRAPVNMLRVEQFAARRENKPKRLTTMAPQMVQLVTTLLSSPKLNVPQEHFVALVNMTLEALDLPKDFRVEPVPSVDPPDVREWVLETLKKYETDFKGLVRDEQNQMLQQILGARFGGQPQPQQPAFLPQQEQAAAA